MLTLLLDNLIDVTGPATFLLACYIARAVWREPGGFARKALMLTYLSLALWALVVWASHIVREHWPADLPTVRAFLNLALLPVPAILLWVALKVRWFRWFK